MASGNKAQSNAPTRRAPPPALNPESCALVQPWKDFVSKGMISALRVEFTPMGSSVTCLVADSLKKESDPAAGIPIGIAKQRIIDAKLWTPRGGQGKSTDGPQSNMLPKKSLVKSDFAGTSDMLASRVAAVAAALGDTTARGRIGSLKLMVEGVDTFEEWWRQAPSSRKTRLVTDAKHHKELTAEDHAAFAAVVPGCPFRGSVPTPTHEEHESDEEDQPIPPQKRNGSPKNKS